MKRTFEQARAVLRHVLSRTGLAFAVVLAGASTTIALIAKPKAAPPTLSIVAGTGSPGFSGDGGQAALAQLTTPASVAKDSAGNLFIGDGLRVRKVTPAGVITTVAGTGEAGFSGDGGPAIEARFESIQDLAVDASGNVYVADTVNHLIRRIATNGIITTIAGNSNFGSGFGGDGGPATSALLYLPYGIAVAASGELYIADSGNHRIRRVDTHGVISTMAGSGSQGYSPDGTLAMQASLDWPKDVVVDNLGRVLIADTNNERIRQIGPDTRLVTIAGGGSLPIPDPVATHVQLFAPISLAIDVRGDLIASTGSRVLRISQAGALEVLAGPRYCYGTDCGSVLDAAFSGIHGVATDSSGNVYAADQYDYKVHMITGYPAPGPLRGANAFTAATTIPTGGIPDAVVVGDVNGDGRDDAVVATLESSVFNVMVDYHVFIFLQNANGTLLNPIKRSYQRVASPVVSLALGDMNNDGVLDIVVGHQSGLTLFPGGSGSSFQETVFDLGYPAHDLFLTDTNDDGNLDVVTMTFGATRATIHKGNGNLGISSSTPGPPGTGVANFMVPGDFNDDGRTDFAMATFYQGTGGYQVFSRGAGEAFNAGPHVAATPFITAGAPKSPFAGDLNRDGRDDLGYVDGAYKNVFWLHPQRPGTGLEAAAQTVATAVQARLGRIADIDQDGRNDVLILHGDPSYQSGVLDLYPGAPAGLAAGVRYPLPQSASVAPYVSRQSLDIGDLNSDGCADVAIANLTYGLVTLRGQNCRQRAGARSDLLGDGTGDIVWRNPATGQNGYWRAGRSGGSATLTTVTDTQWKARQVGDFDGDGRADIFWRHDLSGVNAIWRAGNFQDQQPVTTMTGMSWEVSGTGDFDGDGKDDLLWRDLQTGTNAIWKSASYHSQQAVTGVTDLNWKIAGVADFNGDGKADILWRHATQGRNTIWLSGNSATQQAVATVAPAWRIAGLGDFNGDGRADIVWRNSVGGANVIWRGARSTDVHDITDVTGMDWFIAAAADYNNDGRDDLLWRNGATGVNAIWKSAYYTSQQPVSSLTTAWSVVR